MAPFDRALVRQFHHRGPIISHIRTAIKTRSFLPAARASYRSTNNYERDCTLLRSSIFQHQRIRALLGAFFPSSEHSLVSERHGLERHSLPGNYEDVLIPHRHVPWLILLSSGLSKEKCVKLATDIEDYINEDLNRETPTPPNRPPTGPYLKVLVLHGQPFRGEPSPCHLAFNHPQYRNPNLGAFESLDKVQWIRLSASSQDASSTESRSAHRKRLTLADYYQHLAIPPGHKSWVVDVKHGIPEEECVILAAKLEDHVSKSLPRKPPLPGEPNDLHSSPMPFPRVVVTYIPITPCCHLSYNYPKELDPNLEAFECLDEVEWFGTLPPIRDAGLTA